jgi:hypothetical protein
MLEYCLLYRLHVPIKPETIIAAISHHQVTENLDSYNFETKKFELKAKYIQPNVAFWQ